MSCSWIIQKNKEYRSAYGRPFNASLSPIKYQKYQERGARSDRGIVEIGTAPSKHRLGPTPPFSRRPPMRRCNGSSFKMWKYMFTAFAPERSTPSLGWMVPREQLLVVVLYIFVGIRLSCLGYCETAHRARCETTRRFKIISPQHIFNTQILCEHLTGYSIHVPQCIRRPQEHTYNAEKDTKYEMQYINAIIAF